MSTQSSISNSDTHNTPMKSMKVNPVLLFSTEQQSEYNKANQQVLRQQRIKLVKFTKNDSNGNFSTNLIYCLF
jgi:hypothetical protein